MSSHPCRGLGTLFLYGRNTITATKSSPSPIPYERLRRVPAPVTLQDVGQTALKPRPPGCWTTSHRYNTRI